MDPKKLPPLTPEEIDNLHHWLSLSAPRNLEEGLRSLCAQAKRYPAMVEALENCLKELRFLHKEGRFQGTRIITEAEAALKGETPQ